VESDIRLADEIKNRNNINNATFLNCKPNEIYNKCLPFLIGCVSVAVVHLAPPYGKSNEKYFYFLKLNFYQYTY